jgi:hypothetical protein
MFETIVLALDGSEDSQANASTASQSVSSMFWWPTSCAARGLPSPAG